jgi:hypothetical protein
MGDEYVFRTRHKNKESSLREFEGMDRDQLIDIILQLRKENAELFKKINSETEAQSEYTVNDYKQGWSLPTKVAFLLHLKNKPLTSEDLHKLLLRLVGHYKDYDNPKMNLTTTLKRVSKSKRIIKVKMPGVRELIYALPEWIDKNGKLIVAYNVFKK